MPPSPRKKIVIRKARPADLAAVLAIEQASFPSPWAEEMYLGEFRRPASIFLAAQDEGRVCGYLCAWTVLDEAHVLKLAIAPDRRREGIGRALMAAFMEKRPAGVREVWLEVRDGNRAARLFYAELGFTEVALRRRYYADTGEDAVIMVKRIEE